MDNSNLLHTDREATRKRVLQILNKTENEIQSYVNVIQNWLGIQYHLPEIPDRAMIEIFLIINKFNIKKCKKKLDMYYTIRSIIPDYYLDKNPKLQHMKKIANVICCIPLPVLTESCSRITLIKVIDTNPDRFNTLDFLAHTFNITELRILLEDITVSNVMICDLQGFKMGHFTKFSPVSLKKGVTILENVYSSRIEGIHYINCPPFIQKLVNLIKSFLKVKIRNRIHVHQSLDTLYEYLPKRLLPKDYGGQIMSVEKLNELWQRKLAEKEAHFDKLDTLRVNESLRQSSDFKCDEMLGLHGNFTKLELD